MNQTEGPWERTVLVVLRDGDNILLIRKKRGLGTGKVNVPGGHVEAGETLLQAASRETREETGLTPLELFPVAELWFRFVDGLRLHTTVFGANGGRGTLEECDEAAPFWLPSAKFHGRIFGPTMPFGWRRFSTDALCKAGFCLTRTP